MKSAMVFPLQNSEAIMLLHIAIYTEGNLSLIWYKTSILLKTNQQRNNLTTLVMTHIRKYFDHSMDGVYGKIIRACHHGQIYRKYFLTDYSLNS